MKKKFLLLPILGGFLLSGCKISLFGKTLYLFEKKPDPEKPQSYDDVTPDERQHASSVSCSPSAPFYLKVGETKDLSLTLSPSPTDAAEKEFTWVKNNDHASFEVNPSNPLKATVTGVSAGTTTLTATNKYSDDLVEKFTIKVIDFDSENEYLWEYSDRSPFGYDSKTAPQGLTSGTADLNGMSWDFLRQHVGRGEDEIIGEAGSISIEKSLANKDVIKGSLKVTADNITYSDDGEGNIVGNGLVSGSIDYATGAVSVTFEAAPKDVVVANYSFIGEYSSSLYPQNGGVGFGKDSDPESTLTFKAENNRIVEEIIIEASSANSLGSMTLTVGETKYLDSFTVPRAEEGVIPTIHAKVDAPASGEIKIVVSTPQEPVNDRNPGAFVLKSIWIKYIPENYTGIDFADDSKHKVDYYEGDTFTYEGMKLVKVSDRGYKFPVNMEEALAGEEPKLTHSEVDFDTASHEAVSVELTLNISEQAFKLSYDIHVRSKDWVPEKLVVKGEIEEQSLVAGDAVDYSGLSIDIVYEEESSDIRVVDFVESSEMSFSYGEGKDPFVADMGMEEGYTITVSGKFSGETVEGTIVVASNTIKVAEAIYDRIDYERASTFKEIDDAGLTTSAKSLSYTTGNEGRVRIDFNNVKKENRGSDSKVLPTVNAEFRLTVLDTSLSIKEIKVSFALVKKTDNKFRLFSSIYGGDIYGSQLAEAENQVLEFSEFEKHTDSLRFMPQLTTSAGLSNTNICIQSILVRYEETPHVEYTIECGETMPTKLNYQEPELFDPSGFTVSLKENGTDKSFDITSLVEWYDGPSYDANPKTASKELIAGTTYVYGLFRGEKVAKIEGLTVIGEQISLTLVKSSSEIVEGGKYLIVGSSDVGFTCLNGAETGSGNIMSGTMLNGFEFGDNISISKTHETRYFVASFDSNSKLLFTNFNGNQVGLTNSGSLSCTTSPNLLGWDYEIDSEHHLVMTMMDAESKPKLKEFGVNKTSGKFSAYAQTSARGVIYLYKFAE